MVAIGATAAFGANAGNGLQIVMAGWRRPIELAVNDVVEHFFDSIGHKPTSAPTIHNYVIP